MIADGIVGRRLELDALRAWLAAARDGAGRLVLCAGEPGIGKTRLAQELAGIALAQGMAVAWGRCVEAEGAPAFWPWRQVLLSVGVDPDMATGRQAESPEDRFRLFDEITESLRTAAGARGLVVILDDIHWGDEPSLLVLRHLAHHMPDTALLVFATFRDVEPASALPRVLPDLLRAPAVERLDLRGFGLGEVRDQLPDAADARAVLDLTGGNPLFVREVARAIADGTWRPDRPPRSVVETVIARLDRISPECRRLVQAAAIVGRDFPISLVAATLGQAVADCLPLIDEAIAWGLIDRVGEAGNHRFVHALTREAVDASLTTAGRAALHRAVAQAMETQFAADLSEHLAGIARHWVALAPYGEADIARRWTIRAAGAAVERLAYEEAVRLYGVALALPAGWESEGERCRAFIALGRACYFAGDLGGCLDAAVAAADAARPAQSAELLGEAALAVEASWDPAVNAAARRLCDEALGALGGTGPLALRARLLAQRSHLAYYDGDHGHTESLSAAALGLAREAGDDHALVDALHARKEACPGPAGLDERIGLATEMLAVAQRINRPRTAMWGELWRIDALVESGKLAEAAEELPALRAAVERVGGPVSPWHADRTAACVAQAQGRFSDAVQLGRRAFDRMLPYEPSPARGAYMSLHAALARHVELAGDALEFVHHRAEPVPRFRTLAPITRAFLLLRAGLPGEAEGSFREAGPVDTWVLPAFFTLPGYVFAALVAADLGRHDDLAVVLERLAPFRGAHAAGEGVSYAGPVDLVLGRGAAALGDADRAVADLSTAAGQAERAGARAFLAEAQHHLAAALVARGEPGDSDRARATALEADRSARALGMTAYTRRTAALVARLGDLGSPVTLSPREVEVARLVAEGLTNRQIGERLVISERTAQNHVQHILTKLGFSARSQIAAWMSTRMSNPADGGRAQNS